MEAKVFNQESIQKQRDRIEMDKRIIINNKTKDKHITYLSELVGYYLSHDNYRRSAFISFKGDQYIINPRENKSSLTITISEK
jgi:hypothetical protein